MLLAQVLAIFVQKVVGAVKAEVQTHVNHCKHPTADFPALAAQ